MKWFLAYIFTMIGINMWFDNQTWRICLYLHVVLSIFRVAIKKKGWKRKDGEGKKCYSLYPRVHVREKKARKHQLAIHIYENVHSKVRHSNGTVFNCRRESFFSGGWKKLATVWITAGSTFPFRNIATFQDIRIHFCPFYPVLIGFQACVCVSKGDESLVKIGWAWWPAVKFLAMPMEGGRVAISGKLIHSL